jgi:hypothetical protein
MFVPFIVGTLAVVLAYLTRRKQNGVGLKLAFFVIFVFLALRYDYGNDYMNYLDGYNKITTQFRIYLTGEQWEPGWRLLHLFFRPFGFFAMIAFTSLATCVVFYWFVRSYVPAQYQWLAIFLYFFDPYQMLVAASGMRQNVVILLFLIAIKFLYEKNIIIYLLLTCAGAMFHVSGIILPPLVLLAYINVKLNKFIVSVIGLMFVSMFVFGQTLFYYASQFVHRFTPTYAEQYLYGWRIRLRTGLGFIYSMFQLIAIFYFAGIESAPHTETSEGDDKDMEFAQSLEDSEQMSIDPKAAFLNIDARRLLFKLAIIAFLFTPLSMQSMMFIRLNMYFTPVFIAVFPIILFTTRDRFFHLVFLSSLMAFTLYKFWGFFRSPVWVDKFGTYQTIFSAPQWY